MAQQEEVPFSLILAELLDRDKVFNPAYIFRLSNLGPEETRELAAHWEGIPLNRRRLLVTDLESFAEADALLFFDNVGKIALKDEDAQVRSSAIRLTVLEESPAFATTLLEILRADPHFDVRAEAATALGRYVYLGELEEIPEDIFHSVEEGLLQAYRADQQTLVRRRALEAVSFSSRKEINGMIEDAFTSQDEDWQVSAVFSMGASANTRWEPQVMEMLDADSAQLRTEAAYAAGKLDIKEAKPVLFGLATDDDDESVRRAAIWALSDLGGQNVTDFLEEMLEEAETEEDEEFLEAALENLLDSQLFGDIDLPLFDFDEDDLGDLSALDPDDEDA